MVAKRLFLVATAPGRATQIHLFDPGDPEGGVVLRGLDWEREDGQTGHYVIGGRRGVYLSRCEAATLQMEGRDLMVAI